MPDDKFFDLELGGLDGEQLDLGHTSPAEQARNLFGAGLHLRRRSRIGRH